MAAQTGMSGHAHNRSSRFDLPPVPFAFMDFRKSRLVAHFIMADQSTSQPTLFRKAALSKVHSPEQLDALLPITSPIGWVALLAIGLALAGALAWGFMGTILRTASGQGIIVRDSDVGIFEVSPQAAGVVLDVKVQAGDVVHAGQVVATLDFSQLNEQLANSQEALEKLKEQDAAQSQDEAERLRNLQEKLANQQSLYAKGLLTKTPILDSRSAIYEVKSRSFQRRQQILDQTLKIRENQIKYEQENVVRAAREGRVTEVVVSPGNFVQPGKTIVRLESLKGDYEALVYVPTLEGKKIREGMTARLAPSIAKPEEYGFILAKVYSVSPLPVTREYLLSELGGDENIVQSLLPSGSAIEFVADMEEDPSTPSGFRWSSSKGPDLRLESGTLCQVSVVLERVRPISLLIPYLKKQLGVL